MRTVPLPWSSMLISCRPPARSSRTTSTTSFFSLPDPSRLGFALAPRPFRGLRVGRAGLLCERFVNTVEVDDTPRVWPRLSFPSFSLSLASPFSFPRRGVGTFTTLTSPPIEISISALTLRPPTSLLIAAIRSAACLLYARELYFSSRDVDVPKAVELASVLGEVGESKDEEGPVSWGTVSSVGRGCAGAWGWAVVYN